MSFNTRLTIEQFDRMVAVGAFEKEMYRDWDSSLCYDEGKKAELYAAAEVLDYWVVNIPEQCVRIRREPRLGRYERVDTIDLGGTAHPLAFPEMGLQVSSLFPRWQGIAD